MKRLIRSEFFNAQGNEGNENYIEIFKNPTQDEVIKVKNRDPYNSIRGIIDTNGDIYIWPGNIIHDNLKNPNINMATGFHFAYETNNWVIDVCNLKIKFREAYEMLNNHKDQLSQIGNLNGKIFVGQTFDSLKNGFFNFSNWDEMEKFYNEKFK